ncbi:MAG TPA: tetratricopeptide repeat protein [Xanthobacteraceae bacterium]|jgi:tetratricopeptide (TPR) repeat protein|nr:tetratricopeptide repeat protein [Xanthobacteraceae bacterium]
MQMHEHDATSRPGPTAAFILHQLAITAYNRKNIEVALRFMARACARPEAPGQCHRNHAEMLHRCGRSVEAEAAARLAIRRDQDCAEAWDTLGTILADRGALVESRDCYQTAIQIAPMFLQPLNNLGVVLHNLGQFDEAVACYRRALNLQPENLKIQLNFAKLLADLKRYREGLEVVNRVLNRCPENTASLRPALQLKRHLSRPASSQTAVGRSLGAALRKGRS